MGTAGTWPSVPGISQPRWRALAGRSVGSAFGVPLALYLPGDVGPGDVIYGEEMR